MAIASDWQPPVGSKVAVLKKYRHGMPLVSLDVVHRYTSAGRMVLQASGGQFKPADNGWKPLGHDSRMYDLTVLPISDQRVIDARVAAAVQHTFACFQGRVATMITTREGWIDALQDAADMIVTCRKEIDRIESEAYGAE